MARIPPKQIAGRWWFAVAIGSLALPLLAHAYAGSFTRFAADDYCKAVLVRNTGVWGAALELYRTIEGVFSHSLAAALSNAAGMSIVSAWPTLVILLWLLALTWGGRQLLVVLDIPFPWSKGLLLGLLLLVGTLELAPNYFQILYWQNGILKYTFGPILGTYFLALVFHWLATHEQGRPGIPWLASAGGLAFLGAGFSETYLAVQTAALGLALVIGPFFISRKRRWPYMAFVGIGLVGTLTAAVVILLAPGNAVRQDSTREQIYTSLPALMLAAAGFSSRFLSYFLLKAPAMTFLVPVLSALIAWVVEPVGLRSEISLRSRRAAAFVAGGGVLLVTFLLTADLFGLGGPAGLGTRQLTLLVIAGGITILALMWLGRLLSTPEIGGLVLTAGSTAILVVASFVPSTYALSHAGPLRSHIIPVYVMVCFLGVLGYMIGRGCGRFPIRGKTLVVARWLGSLTLVLLLAGGPLRSALAVGRLVPEVRMNAARWDAQQAAIIEARAVGIMEQRVDILGFSGGTETITEDPHFWVNVCMADYYQLNAIVAGDRSTNDFPIYDWRSSYGWEQ